MESDNLNNSLIPINNKLNKLGDLIRITEKLTLRERIYVPYLKRNGKYIYVDTETLAPLETIYEFDYAELFNDQLAIVGIDGNFNVLNKFGKLLFETNYRSITINNANRVIVVEFDGKFGLIDFNGKKLTQIKFKQISNFKNGIALAELNHLSGLLDNNGNEITPFIYYWNYRKYINFNDGLQAISFEQKFGFINHFG